MDEKTYRWSDPDVAVIIDREYLEELAQDQGWGILNEEDKLSDRAFELLRNEVIEGLSPLLYDCADNVETMLHKTRASQITRSDS